MASWVSSASSEPLAVDGTALQTKPPRTNATARLSAHGHSPWGINMTENGFHPVSYLLLMMPFCTVLCLLGIIGGRSHQLGKPRKIPGGLLLLKAPGIGVLISCQAEIEDWVEVDNEVSKVEVAVLT